MTRNTHPLLKSAVLSVLATGLVSTMALAQYRVDLSAANDANKRIGSNGRNEVDNRLNPWQISNAIVNGNVTGGKEFRGNVQSGDTFAFRGNRTADRISDNFIRGSSGVNTNGTVSNNASNTTLFYGNSRAAPPPPGITTTLQQNPNGSYTPPAPVGWTTVDPRQQATSQGPITVFAPADSNGPGPVDSTFAPYARGVSPLNALETQSQATLSDYTNINPDLTNQLTPAQVDKMRNAAEQGGQGNQPGQSGQPLQPGQLNNAVPTAQPTNGALNNNGISDNVNPAPLSNALTPLPGQEPGMVSRVASPTGGTGSPYTALAERRGEQEQATRPGQAAEQSAQDFNAALKARKDAEAKKNGTDQPAPANHGAAQPGVNRPGANTPANAPSGPASGAPAGSAPKPAMPKPVKVGSLGGKGDSGVDALMKKAETQMRDGKFASAIDTYDSAEQANPKNSLIRLGRTNAELGGSYYRRAALGLRNTFTQDHNLLAGQYDLRAYIGDERLATIQKDLSDLIQKNPNDIDAAVLLAYVYYNTGNERRAQALLDLADKRANGKDDFVKLLKNSWNFGADDNK